MVLSYPTSTNLPWVDGLSMDPQDLGRHSSCEDGENHASFGDLCDEKYAIS